MQCASSIQTAHSRSLNADSDRTDVQKDAAFAISGETMTILYFPDRIS
jgi:hypothetical protein